MRVGPPSDYTALFLMPRTHWLCYAHQSIWTHGVDCEANRRLTGLSE